MFRIITVNGIINGNGYMISSLIVSLLLVVGFYALRSIGVFCLAKKAGEKNLFLAFIPFAWIYLCAKLCGDVFVFGAPVKKFHVFMLISYCISYGITVFYYGISVLPVLLYYLQGGEVFLNVAYTRAIYNAYPLLSGIETRYFIAWDFLYQQQFINAMQVISVFSFIFSLINIVLLVSMYSALFRKYWPQHFVLATILSIFGLFSVFVFAVRNKKPVNYAEYVRQRLREFYGDPNDPNNPYYRGNGNNPDGGQEGVNGGEFASEFGKPEEKDGGDPFSDFPDSDNGKN